MILNNEEVEALILMAEDARPFNDDEWGSERQVDAENAFAIRVMDEVLEGRDDLQDKIESYAMKATLDERINFMMEMVLEPPFVEEQADGLPATLFHDDETGVDVHNPYSSECGRFTVQGLPQDTYKGFAGYLDMLKRTKENSPKLPR